MTKGKLGAAEKERLIAASLRDKQRKQAAYQRAKAALQQRGLVKIEKFVPAAKVVKIQGIAAQLVELHARGMQNEIRIIMVPEAGLSSEATAEEAILPLADDVQAPVAPGLGAKRRKRAQNDRYRERKRAKGLKRLAFSVPASAADWVSAMISQIIDCYISAMMPVIEVSGKPMAPAVSPASACQISPAPSQDWTVGKPWPASPEGSEQSALYDDIQAVVRLMKLQQDPKTSNDREGTQPS